MDKIKNIDQLKKRIEKINPWQVVFLLIIFWIMFATLRTINSNRNLQAKVDDVQDSITTLELTNDNLRFKNDFYESEDYKDLALRTELNKILPGESVLIVSKTDEKYAPITTEDEVLTRQQERSNFQLWIDFLFGLEV